MHGEGQALALRFFEICDQAIANYRRLVPCPGLRG